MKYAIRVTCYEIHYEVTTYYTYLKKAVIDKGLNYGTFQNWKSKNKIDYPITYKGFLFEKVEIL